MSDRPLFRFIKALGGDTCTNVSASNYLYDRYMVGGKVAEAIEKLISSISGKHKALKNNPDEDHTLIGIMSVNGIKKAVWAQAASDTVIFDVTNPRDPKILLITRADPPGAGKKALSGGFSDPNKTGVPETLIKTALRELGEEAGEALKAAIGDRTPDAIIDRRFITPDYREWTAQKPRGSVEPGDLIAMASAASVFVLTGVADKAKAGDDALAAEFVSLSKLKIADLALPVGHGDIIREAAIKVRLDKYLPAELTPKRPARRGILARLGGLRAA